MSISSVSSVVFGSIFIKENFRRVFFMNFKAYFWLSLGCLIVSGLFWSVGSLISLVTEVDIKELAEAYHLPIRTAVSISLLFSALLLALPFCAVPVAMIRSVTLNQPLNGGVLPMIFDKCVIKYLGVHIVRIVLLMFFWNAVYFCSTFIGPYAYSLFVIVPYLFFRFEFILIGVALGEPLGNVFSKTKGMTWKAFKLVFLSQFFYFMSIFALIIAAALIGGLIFAILSLAFSDLVAGVVLGSIGFVLYILFIIALINFAYLGTASLAHAYKGIK